MDENIRGELGNLIMDSLLKIQEMEPGSKERASEVENLSKLYKSGLEDVRVQNDADEKYDNRQNQKEENRKDRIVKLIIGSVTVFVPAFLASYWTSKGLKFEETGTHTSFHAKAWMQKVMNFLKI